MSDNVIVRAGEIASANVAIGERVYIRGSDGQDGFSPTVSVTRIPGGHSVSITDANGIQSFSVLDGQDGATGATGAQGPQGPAGAAGAAGAQGPAGAAGNGIAGIAKTSASGLVDTYTVTFTNGSTTTFCVTNGADGTVTPEQMAAAIAAALEGYARADGYYDELAVGSAEQLIATVADSESVPYNFRTSGGSADIGNRETDMLVGGTLVWNQLAQASDTAVTVPSGHRFLAFLNGAWSVGTSGGAALAVDGAGGDMVFDLTQLFGSAIADYLHSLETATTGAGVAWFRRLFPKAYYAYNAGELMSVKVSAHNTVGFNAWDEEWELGAIDLTNGQNKSSNSTIRSKNFTKVIPSTDYYFYCQSLARDCFRIIWYDADKHFVSNEARANRTNTVNRSPSNAHYLRIYCSSLYGADYKHDICINISWSGYRNGEYEPYEKHSYLLDSGLTLRGIPKLDAGNRLYFDGDTYESDGTVTRRCQQRAYQAGDESLADAITDGTNTVVKLATPTTEAADPYTNPQIVDDFGTEEYVDAAFEAGTRDVSIPVGHDTRYMANLRDKLQHLPDLASANGLYGVQQIGQQMTLVPLPVPAAPTTNGSYTLKCAVSGGAATYSWEAVT